MQKKQLSISPAIIDKKLIVTRCVFLLSKFCATLRDENYGSVYSPYEKSLSKKKLARHLYKNEIATVPPAILAGLNNLSPASLQTLYLLVQLIFPLHTQAAVNPRLKIVWTSTDHSYNLDSPPIQNIDEALSHLQLFCTTEIAQHARKKDMKAYNK